MVQSIVDKAGIKSTDVVLEIGPGTGNLTMKLLERARRVIAIEVDHRMVSSRCPPCRAAPLGHPVHCCVGKLEAAWLADLGLGVVLQVLELQRRVQGTQHASHLQVTTVPLHISMIIQLVCFGCYCSVGQQCCAMIWMQRSS